MIAGGVCTPKASLPALSLVTGAGRTDDLGQGGPLLLRHLGQQHRRQRLEEQQKGPRGRGRLGCRQEMELGCGEANS